MIALKVRRPGIEKVVQADLDILKNLSMLAERRLPFLAPYAPVAIAREFERSLKRELDLTVELRTMERCRVQLAREPVAHVPLAFKQYSTARVLAMEFIGGVGVNDLEGIKALGVEPSEVAQAGRPHPPDADLHLWLLPRRPAPGQPAGAARGRRRARWITGCSARSTWRRASGSPTY